MLSHPTKAGLTAARAALNYLCLAVLAVGPAGCGRGTDSGADTKAGALASTAAPSNGASPTSRSELQHPIVQINTNLGAIKLRLDAEKAPGTVRNFLNYVNEGFYKNVIFHYVLPGKMIVGGGYTADYELKPASSTIRNEARQERKNLRGTIAMARDSALIDSGSSQFFINLEDAPQRDHAGESPAEYGYCVFGDVIEGLDVAEEISQAPTIDKSDNSADLVQTPKTPVVISDVKVL